ncbi:hypothetical protein RA307_04730 [Xanthobacteraceae bacterium Astr-EGSB]|uniref:hypothetical protein n=1 Tax=Astrobacterium formosum TaxID=3069710 RepID=UPI0027B2A7FE|nr:hypothetical protein [Xanthobacteraceae bacterium Astr-EGSB]
MADLRPPLIDFSRFADPFDGYMAGQKARRDEDVMEARRQAVVMGPDGKPDLNATGVNLLRAGDREGFTSLATLASGQAARDLAARRDERDFAFRQDEARRAQGNSDRSYRLQEKAATEKPQYMKGANDEIIEIKPYGGGVSVVTPQGSSGGSNPYAYGKMNENQSKDAGYANRMFQSEQVLRDEKLATASQSMTDRLADRWLPGDVSNKFVSEGYQKYDQAARDFINATLRRESGAAISQSEFDNAYKQYLPRPGDTPEVLAQKQRNRQATIAGIAGGGGQSYKPPYAFGPNGEMVPTGAGMQGDRGAAPVPQLKTKDQVGAAASEARDMIAKIQASGIPEVEKQQRIKGVINKAREMGLSGI